MTTQRKGAWQTVLPRQSRPPHWRHWATLPVVWDVVVRGAGVGVGVGVAGGSATQMTCVRQVIWTGGVVREEDEEP